MGTLRKRYKVWWDGGDEVIVRTTAKDLITAVDMPGAMQNNVSIASAQIYCALVRDGHQLDDYEKWLDLLDDYQAVPLVVEVEGPTQAGPSDIGLSLSPASQEQIGDLGLMMTTEP